MGVDVTKRPVLDWSQWAGLRQLLSQKGRVARELVDPIIPDGALASWLYVPAGAGTLSYPTFSGGTIGGATMTTGATIGNAGVVRMAKTSTTPLVLQPDKFNALAFVVEGLSFGTSDGFDFSLGFTGNSGTVGGAYLFQPNGQTLGEIRSYSASGANLSRTPRTVTDAVTTAGSKIITSATAAFDATDAAVPLTGDDGSMIVPSTLVESVDSTTQIHSTIPMLSTGSGQTLTIGQTVPLQLKGTGVFPGKRNLAVVWFPNDAWMWVMQDDQVVAEVDFSKVKNYQYNAAVQCGFYVVNQNGVAASMSWQQIRFLAAHN